MKKKILALLLVLCLGCSLLTACGGKTNNGPTGKDTPTGSDRAAANEITVGIAQDLDESLDPHKAVAAGTKEVMFNVFEGLVKPDKDGNLIPAIASEVNVAEDGGSYTFTLRDGVKFHNGEAVTMQDVLYSINRNADDSAGEPLIPALSVIADMTAEDNRLTVTLEQPDSDFLAYMTLAILPENYDKQDTAPVWTGPFRFVSRTAQDSIVLERFADYWGAPAKLDRVTYKVIENAQGLLLGLQSGALDLVSHLGSTQTSQLSEKDFRIEEGTMNLVQALYLNNAEKPFDDVRVRQALCYAVDKQAVLELAFDGYGHPLGSSMFPAFGRYFDGSLTDYYTQDTEKAKALLAEAGYPDGFDMTVTVPSNYQPHMDTAEVLSEMLGAVGIRVTILPVEWSSWLSDVYGGRKFQSTVIGVDASNLTADALLGRFYSTASNNFTNYSNAEFDALYEQAQNTFDEDAYTSLVLQMEKNLTENAANVYIQDMADLVAVRKGLAGLQFYPLYVLDAASLYWADTAVS